MRIVYLLLFFLFLFLTFFPRSLFAQSSPWLEIMSADANQVYTNKYLNNPSASQIQFAFTHPTATSVIYSDRADFAGASWEVYQPNAGSNMRRWTFSTQDGIKKIFVRFKDDQGEIDNISAQYVLDTTPPVGGVSLDPWTVGKNILVLTVSLGAQDNLTSSNNMSFRISDNLQFTNAPWQKVQPSIRTPVYIENKNNGDKIPFYIQYRDQAGNISDTYSAEATVDKKPPTIYAEIPPSNSLTQTIHLSGYDELSDLAQMYLSNDPRMIDDVVKMPYKPDVAWTFDYRRVVWIVLEDSVGNKTEPYPSYLGFVTSPTPTPSPDIRQPSTFLTEFEAWRKLFKQKKATLADFQKIRSKYYSSPTLIDPHDAIITTFHFLYQNQIVPENSLIGFSNGQSFIAEITSDKGNGRFSQPIWLKIEKNIDSEKQIITQLPIYSTGLYSANSFTDVVDIGTNPSKRWIKNVTFRIFSEDYPSLEKKVTYGFKKQFSNEGMGTLNVTVSSTRSQQDTLDRVLIPGANVMIYKEGTSTSLATNTSGAGGFVSFRDLEPGTYLVKAEYKGKISGGDYVKIQPDGLTPPLDNGVFVTVPVGPSEVNIPPGQVNGRVVFHQSQDALKANGVPVSLYSESGSVITQTQTDKWGLFSFVNIPGDKTYYLDFTPPQGWKHVHSDTVRNKFTLLSSGSYSTSFLITPIN